MARLTRITGKIFGETATSTGDDPQIGQFGSALAGTYVGTTDVATIQSLPAWSNGFIDAVTASNQYPPLPEMTGFGKVLSYQQNYLMQQGIPEWDSGTTYYTNNFCSKDAKIFYSLTDSNLNNDPAIDSINWKEFTSGGGNEIGDIVFRPLPTKDAGKHLLDGTLLDGSGSYAAFVQYIANLYTDNPTANYFETEANWQASVTQYGVCGKFVYNSTNNTVRLPKITGFVEGTIDVSALGDLVEAGLPNITGYFCSTDDNRLTGYVGGAFSYAGDVGTGTGGTSNETSLSFDASRSNSIYGNSNTVQPQAIKGFFYIVVAQGAKTSLQVDIDEIATDLNGKADVDLSNTSNTLSNSFLNRLVPDYDNGISIAYPALSYTAPSAGIFYFQVYGGTGGAISSITINGNTVIPSLAVSSGEYRNVFSYVVAKNDVIEWTVTYVTPTFYFYPLKGAN